VDGDQLTVESGTISADLTGDIALVKTGPGTVVLSGDNDYTGGTTLESGTLRVAGSDALGGGGLYLNGGTLDLNGFDTTIASLNGSGGTITDDSTTPGTTTLTTSTSACAWYYGAISDGAVRQVAFHVTGGADMVLRGNNTYTGGTIIDAGSWLWSGNDDQGGISGDVVDNGALLFGAAQSFSGAISGSGCVEVRSM
jgi:autotransporter-associated beta strand protein